MHRYSQTQFKIYSEDKQLNIDGFNSITFYNQGDVTVKINSVIKLKPDMQITIAQADPDVIDKTQYYINFLLSDPDTTGTNMQLATIASYTTIQ